jgi:hypothetical protein
LKEKQFTSDASHELRTLDGYRNAEVLVRKKFLRNIKRK